MNLQRVVILSLLLLSAASGQQKTQIVMLGTGMPVADPERSGPATAIVVNGSSYIVDCGPGVVRRASAAAKKHNIPSLEAGKLKIVFLTHLHSDHTVGLPDLIFSSWVMGRADPLKVYGPPGVRAMTDHLESAWSEDIVIRTTGGEPSNKTGYKADVHEIAPGPIYKDANVTVTAFNVKHGAWGNRSFGYIFQTANRKIVISGDTSPTDAVARACEGCDVLIHEAYSANGVESRTAAWKAYFAKFHTSSRELAKIATEARPGLLILYHQMFMGRTEDELLAEVRKDYSGKVVSAKDLDVY